MIILFFFLFIHSHHYNDDFFRSPISYFVEYNEMVNMVLNVQQYFAARIYEPVAERKIHTQALIQRIDKSNISPDVAIGLKEFLQELLDADLAKKPEKIYIFPEEDALVKLKKILRKNHIEFDSLCEKSFEDVVQYVEKSSQSWNDIIKLIVRGKYLAP